MHIAEQHVQQKKLFIIGVNFVKLIYSLALNWSFMHIYSHIRQITHYLSRANQSLYYVCAVSVMYTVHKCTHCNHYTQCSSSFVSVTTHTFQFQYECIVYVPYM